MKTNSESSLCHGLRSWLCRSVLFLAWLSVPAGAGESKPPEKIKSAVLGMVATQGIYPLNQPATIEAAFEAAGGWKPCSVKTCWPSKYCLLKIKNSRGKYDDAIRISIMVNRDTGKVEVTDPEWQTLPLPDTFILEMPEVLW